MPDFCEEMIHDLLAKSDDVDEREYKEVCRRFSLYRKPESGNGFDGKSEFVLRV